MLTNCFVLTLFCTHLYYLGSKMLVFIFGATRLRTFPWLMVNLPLVLCCCYSSHRHLTFFVPCWSNKSLPAKKVLFRFPLHFFYRFNNCLFVIAWWLRADVSVLNNSKRNILDIKTFWFLPQHMAGIKKNNPEFNQVYPEGS